MKVGADVVGWEGESEGGRGKDQIMCTPVYENLNQRTPIYKSVFSTASSFRHSLAKNRFCCFVLFSLGDI